MAVVVVFKVFNVGGNFSEGLSHSCRPEWAIGKGLDLAEIKG